MTDRSRSVLVALDPGSAKAGCAVFEKGVLVDARDFRGEGGWWLRARKVADWVATAVNGQTLELVFERPQVYVSSRSKGNRNALIDVAYMAGATVGFLASQIERVRDLYPHEWKRNVPKDVCRQRLLDLLSSVELAVAHRCKADGWDAVGLGVVHLGRALPGLIRCSS